LGTKHITSSVEHLQTNGQSEAANKVILGQLKKRLGTAKENARMSCSRCFRLIGAVPQSSTEETPYNLTYGTATMLPVEVGEITMRRQLNDIKINEECMKTKLDLMEELLRRPGYGKKPTSSKPPGYTIQKSSCALSNWETWCGV